jgi:hypothetical protein
MEIADEASAYVLLERRSTSFPANALKNSDTAQWLRSAHVNTRARDR